MITYKTLKAWQEQIDAARHVLPTHEQEVHSTLSKLSDEINGALITLVTEADPTAPFDMGAFANDVLRRMARPANASMGVLT